MELTDNSVTDGKALNDRNNNIAQYTPVPEVSGILPATLKCGTSQSLAWQSHRDRERCACLPERVY